MLWSGEWVWRLEPGAPSSEAEFHPMGRQALERGGVSPEGASGPRARRSLRGVAPGPRARRKLAQGDRGRSVGGPMWLLRAVGLCTFGLRLLGTCL
jgi:hypothetical protein